MEKYTLTLHIGRRTKTGFGVRFKITSRVKGDSSYKTAGAMIALLDERVIEQMGLQCILDINGIYIPNDFDDKGYTIEEAYKQAIKVNTELLVESLIGGNIND